MDTILLGVNVDTPLLLGFRDRVMVRVRVRVRDMVRLGIGLWSGLCVTVMVR